MVNKPLYIKVCYHNLQMDSVDAISIYCVYIFSTKLFFLAQIAASRHDTYRSNYKTTGACVPKVKAGNHIALRHAD